MFGGLAFLVNGHMAVAASREGGVLLSVDRGDTDALLEQQHTRPMVMRCRELSGWVQGVADGPNAWDGYAATAVADACVESLSSGERAEVRLADRPALYG